MELRPTPKPLGLGLALLMLPCFSGVSGAEPPGPTDPSRATTVVLGHVERRTQRRCLKDWKTERVNAYHTVGGVRLLDGGPDLARQVGGIAIVLGVEVRDFKWPTVQHEVPCPVMQARSDWIPGGGIRRGPALGLWALRPSKVTPTEAPVVVRSKDELHVTFRNDLPSQLWDLRIALHYEGCYGKPGTFKVEHKTKRLAPGKTVKAVFKVLETRSGVGLRPRQGYLGRRAKHMAHTLRIDGSAAGHLVLIEVGLGKEVGIKHPCR